MLIDSVVAAIVAWWLVRRLARMKREEQQRQKPKPEAVVHDEVADWSPCQRGRRKVREEFGPFDDGEIARHSVRMRLGEEEK